MTLDELRRAARGDADALAGLKAALRQDDPAELAAASLLPPLDAARLLLLLSPTRARKLLARLDDAPSLAALGELEPATAARLLDADVQRRLVKLVGRLEVADAADLLAQAPPALVEQVLAQAGSPELRAALDHRAWTVGSIMRHRFIAVPAEWTIADVIAAIRAHAERIDKLYAVYVIDPARRLQGYLKLRDLLLCDGATPVGTLVRPEVTAISATADRAEVLALAREQRLPVLPVVDAEQRLVGIVTTAELVEIAEAEADEDMKLMAGLAPEASAADGPWQIVPRRLPWLAGGLFGAGIAAVVVGAYEDALTEAAILASLIPIVMSLAGNAGIQASTVTVQAMSAGTLWTGDLRGRLLREIGGALLNGGLVGTLVGLGILILSTMVEIHHPLSLALTALLTLVVVTVQASTIGSMIPLLLDRLKFDPAVATGVFITTSNDVMGVLIFFKIASALYL